jgi:hypothetical protein
MVIHSYDLQGTDRILVARNKTILATNMGIIYSIDFHKSSYQSELYGMMAGLMTLSCIIYPRQDSITIPMQIELITDNIP